MKKILVGLTAVAVLTGSLNAMGGADKGKKHGIMTCISKVSNLTAEQKSSLKEITVHAKSGKSAMKRMMIPKGNLSNFLGSKGFDKSAFIKTKKELMAHKVEKKAGMIAKMMKILTPSQIMELKKIVQVKATKKLFQNLSAKAVLGLKNAVEQKALTK